MHQMKKEHPDICGPSVVVLHQQDCMLDDDDQGIPRVRYDRSDNIATYEAIEKALERGLVRVRFDLAQLLIAEGREDAAAPLLAFVNRWKESQCSELTSTQPIQPEGPTPGEYRD